MKSWLTIATAESQALYQLLVAKVRAEHCPVTVSFRYDASICRRAMRLRIALLTNDSLEGYRRLGPQAAPAY